MNNDQVNHSEMSKCNGYQSALAAETEGCSKICAGLAKEYVDTVKIGETQL